MGSTGAANEAIIVYPEGFERAWEAAPYAKTRDGGLGEEQRAGIAGGGVEKVRGLVPVVGDRGIGALG